MAHALFLDHAHTTADLIQAESGKNRRMAIEETCDPPMVMSHYLKRAARLLAPVRRGGPVPLLTTSTEIRRRIAEGRSIRYWVPDGVLEIIRDEKLYGIG